MERIQDASLNALELARRHSDPVTLLSVLSAWHTVHFRASTCDERLRVSTEMVEIAERMGDAEMAFQAHTWRFEDCFESADRAGIDRALAARERLARDLRQPHCRWVNTVVRASIFTLEGRSFPMIRTGCSPWRASQEPPHRRVRLARRRSEAPLAALDPAAKAAYRTRVAALRETLEEAEERNDCGTAERARAEIRFVEDELSTAIGLGGRDRATGSSAERARSTVTKGIKSAIAKLAAAHPTLGRHFDRTLRTGVFCAYRPDDDGPRWQL